MIYNRYIYTLIFVFTFFQGFSQKFYNRPRVLNDPIDNVRLKYGDLNNQDKSDEWNVFAAWDGIELKAGKESDFMQKFQVIGDRRASNQRIQLHLYNKFEEQDYGWVDTENLLLTEFARLDKGTGFRLKYLPVTKVGEIDPRFLEDDGYSVKFYTGPSTEYDVNFTVKAFSGFWYLYKKVGSWYLLGRSSKLDNGLRVDPKLIGWIQEGQLLPWDQRLVLQPNQDKGAVKERLSQGIVITAFYDSLEAVNYAKDPQNAINKAKNIFSPELQDSYNKSRLNAENIRWPVLSNTEAVSESINQKDKKEVFKVGVKGRPTSTTSVDYNQTELDALDTIWTKQRVRSGKVNVVFVIDATYSMGEYIASVKDAMLYLARTLNGQQKANYSFGAVLYTDASEGQSFKVRSSNQLMNFSDISNWLTGKQEYYTSKNQSLKEGVFYGLRKGRELLHSARETNFIVHIGDAGGNDFEEEYEQLVSEFLQFDVSVISIQVHNPISNRTLQPLLSYQDFHIQMRDMLLDLVNRQDSVLKENIGSSLYSSFFASLNVGESGLRYENDPSLSNNQYSTYATAKNRYPIKSYLQLSHPGHNIPAESFTRFVQQKIVDIEIENNQLLNEVLTSKGEGLGEKTFKASIVDQLLKAGFSKADVTLWLGRAYEALLEVYVPRKIEGVKHPLLEFALFIDQEELTGLRKNLLKLIDSDQTQSQFWDPDNPKGFEQILKGLLSIYVDSKSVGDLNSLQLSTALRLMVGLSQEYESDFIDYLTRNGQLQNPKISDLRYGKFDRPRLVNAIDKIYEQLSPVNWEKQAFLGYNKQKYYWIPQRELVIRGL